MTYRMHLQQLVGRTFQYTRDDINKAITHVRCHVRGLEVNGPFKASHMATALVESYIDEDMFREWTLHTSKIKKVPSHDALLDFLEEHSMALPAKSKTKVSAPPAEKKMPKAMSFTIHDQTKCPVCGEKSHSIYPFGSNRWSSGSQTEDVSKLLEYKTLFTGLQVLS